VGELGTDLSEGVSVESDRSCGADADSSKGAILVSGDRWGRGRGRTRDATLEMIGFAIVPFMTAGSDVADEIFCGEISCTLGLVRMVIGAG